MLEDCVALTDDKYSFLVHKKNKAKTIILDKFYSVHPVLTENFPLPDLVSETSTGVETTANSSTSLR